MEGAAVHDGNGGEAEAPLPGEVGSGEGQGSKVGLREDSVVAAARRQVGILTHVAAAVVEAHGFVVRDGRNLNEQHELERTGISGGRRARGAEGRRSRSGGSGKAGNQLGDVDADVDNNAIRVVFVDARPEVVEWGGDGAPPVRSER